MLASPAKRKVHAASLFRPSAVAAALEAASDDLIRWGRELCGWGHASGRLCAQVQRAMCSIDGAEAEDNEMCVN